MHWFHKQSSLCTVADVRRYLVIFKQAVILLFILFLDFYELPNSIIKLLGNKKIQRNANTNSTITLYSKHTKYFILDTTPIHRIGYTNRFMHSSNSTVILHKLHILFFLRLYTIRCQYDHFKLISISPEIVPPPTTNLPAP